MLLVRKAERPGGGVTAAAVPRTARDDRRPSVAARSARRRPGGSLALCPQRPAARIRSATDSTSSRVRTGSGARRAAVAGALRGAPPAPPLLHPRPRPGTPAARKAATVAATAPRDTATPGATRRTPSLASALPAGPSTTGRWPASHRHPRRRTRSRSRRARGPVAGRRPARGGPSPAAAFPRTAPGPRGPGRRCRRRHTPGQGELRHAPDGRLRGGLHGRDRSRASLIARVGRPVQINVEVACARTRDTPAPAAASAWSTSLPDSSGATSGLAAPSTHRSSQCATERASPG